MRPFAIAQFTLHQSADGSPRLRMRDAAVDDDTIRTALLSVFGPSQQLTIEPLTAADKIVQYASDLP
ncbi:MAG TPA: hypothetical protein VJL59_17900 [Anaerolineales bacterium]|nr:hypothetical protein [Anaerolineales bacterium]